MSVARRALESGAGRWVLVVERAKAQLAPVTRVLSAHRGSSHRAVKHDVASLLPHCSSETAAVELSLSLSERVLHDEFIDGRVDRSVGVWAGRFGLSTTNLTSDEPQPQSYQTDIAGMSHLLLCTRGAGAALTMPVMRIDVVVRTSFAPARGGIAETAGARAASQPQQQLDVTMAGGYGLWPVSPHVSLGLHDAMGACVSAYDSLARTHALRGVPAVLVPLHARVYPQSHCDSGNSSGAERATFCASVCCLMPNVAWPVASVPACPSVACLSATVWGEVLRDMHSRCSPSYIFYWHCSRFALDRSCVLVRRRTFAHSHTLRRWLRCVAYSRTYVAGTRVRHMWRRYRRVWLMRNGARTMVSECIRWS